MTKAFICAGQSNMAGGIVRDQLPESYLSWPNSVRCFGVDGPFNPVEHEKAGPEVGMAEEIVAHWSDQPVVIIKHAIGGSNLANEWSPTTAIRQPDEPEQRRLCFPDLQQALRLAQQQTDAPLEFCGFAWMQGERDSRSPGMTATYYRHLHELIEAVRALTETPDLPIAIGRITPRCRTDDGKAFRHTHRNLVRQAQEKYCQDHALATLVDTDDLPQRQDALHFNTAGCLELGRRFARVFLG